MSEPAGGVAVPDTRLHPIYLIIGTAKTVRQAIPFLMLTIFGGAPRVDERSVVLRWRRFLDRNTVIAHRAGSQLTQLSSSPGKAKAGVAGFTMRFSSGRGARIRYMVESDALLLLHAVGRAGAGN